MKLADVVKQRLSGEISKCQTVVIEDRTFVLAKEVTMIFKGTSSATIGFYNDEGKLIHSQPLEFMGWKNLYENTLTINLPYTWVLLEVKDG